MFCAKAPRTLRGKDNCCPSSSNCWGKIFHLSEADSQRFGFKTKVCLCLKHYEEKTPANSACCFPKRSDSDKCSGCLVICPQRLVTVFETISPPKTSSSKICHGHLKKADNDDRIIGNKYSVQLCQKGKLTWRLYSMGDPSFISLTIKSWVAQISWFAVIVIASDNIPKAKQRFHQQIPETGVNSWRS